MEVLYKDDSILITNENITINGYYFPTGQSKIIRWDQVRTISVEPLTTFNGKYRLWGMGMKPYWFNSDWRASKEFMFVVDTGKFIKSAITPDDFEAARKAIASKMVLS